MQQTEDEMPSRRALSTAVPVLRPQEREPRETVRPAFNPL
jgi:hypothetical protein